VVPAIASCAIAERRERTPGQQREREEDGVDDVDDEERR
jgi:hypothetical protein